jgi:UDP-N-acetylglucosamine 1-carboxyvinyltransferase
MDRESFQIKGLGGEKTLSGSITIGGAKNSVLPALAAALVFDDELKLSNVPDIEDVKRMEEILIKLGASITREEDRVVVSTREMHETILDAEAAKRMRASVILTGPILARFGKTSFPHPGGCVIGPRPIDFFLSAYEKMGATVKESDQYYEISAKDGKLHGADIFFTTPSVTATEAVMLAAVLAEGTTTIANAAMEPEISDLAQFLARRGAKISGIGTPNMTIIGTGLLHADGEEYRIIPDRIELGSFLILGALAADQLSIEKCNPAHAESVIATLKESGVPITVENDTVLIRGNGKIPNRDFKSFNIKTHEYPGFPTDILAPITVFLTQVTGEGVVFETIYENRLNYAQDLIHMGADIKVWDAHHAMVKGPTPLKGREVDGPDIRAGLAFLIAGIIAKGDSTINNAYFIDRGYANIEKRLQAIGVSIERTNIGA